ncbi:hypothetical protein [Labilibaculum sp.]
MLIDLTFPDFIGLKILNSLPIDYKAAGAELRAYRAEVENYSDPQLKVGT